MTKLTIAATALGASLIALPALASAQPAPSATKIDCMQRDGGPTGCSMGQTPYRQFFHRSYRMRDYYGYYAPRRSAWFF